MSGRTLGHCQGLEQFLYVPSPSSAKLIENRYRSLLEKFIRSAAE